MIIPPGFAEVTYRWRPAAGYRVAMTSCAFTIAAWDEDVEEIRSQWANYFSTIGGSANGFAAGVEVKVGTTDPTAPITYQLFTESAGVGDIQIAPPNVSHMATKRTLRGGRKGKGRMFLPAINETQIGRTGGIDPTFLAGLQDALDDLLNNTAALLDTSPQIVLLHSDGLDDPTDVTSVQVEPIVATQRRRLVR